MLLNKYSGKLGKVEAEVVQTLLDMNNGDELATRRFIIKALKERERQTQAYDQAMRAYHEQLDAFHRQTPVTKIRRRLKGLPPLTMPEPPVFAPTPEEEVASTIVIMTMISGSSWYFDGLVHLGLAVPGQLLPPCSE